MPPIPGMGPAVARAALPFGLAKTLHVAPGAERVAVTGAWARVDDAIAALGARQLHLPGGARPTTAALLAPERLGGPWTAVPLATPARAFEPDAARAVRLGNLTAPGGGFDLARLADDAVALVDGPIAARLP